MKFKSKIKKIVSALLVALMTFTTLTTVIATDVTAVSPTAILYSNDIVSQVEIDENLKSTNPPSLFKIFDENIKLFKPGTPPIQSSSNLELLEPYYSPDKIELTTSILRLNSFVASSSNLNLSSSNITSQVDDFSILYSKNSNININSSNITMNGIIYAPNGTVTINSANMNFSGAIIAKKIVLNGTNLNLTPNDVATEIISTISQDLVLNYSIDANSINLNWNKISNVSTVMQSIEYGDFVSVSDGDLSDYTVSDMIEDTIYQFKVDVTIDYNLHIMTKVLTFIKTNGIIKLVEDDVTINEPLPDGIEIYEKPLSPENIMTDPFTGDQYVKNQILVTAKKGVTKEQVSDIVGFYQGEIVGYISSTNDYQIEFTRDYSKPELDNIGLMIEYNPSIECVLEHLVMDNSFSVTDSTMPETEDETKSTSDSKNSNDQLENADNIDDEEMEADDSGGENQSDAELGTEVECELEQQIAESSFAKTQQQTRFIPNINYPNDPWDNAYNDNGELMGANDWDVTNPSGANWGMEAIKAPAAWAAFNKHYKNKGDTGTKVGLIDSAVFPHWDLDFKAKINDTMVKPFIDEGDLYLRNKRKRVSHGTHVAGTIGAKFDNERGVSGVAPNAELYSAAVLETKQTFTLKRCLAELIVRDVKVINFSAGYYDPSILATDYDEYIEEVTSSKLLLENFLLDFIEQGYEFVIVMSAGNDSDFVEKTDDTEEKQIWKDSRYSSFFTALTEPSVLDRIIVVGSIANLGNGAYEVSNFSQIGNRVDIMAPGTDIVSTVNYIEPNTGKRELYATMSGTSMAAPHVSGVATMLWGIDPNFTGKQIKDMIISSAKQDVTVDLGNNKIYLIKDDNGKIKTSYPILNAHEAVITALFTVGIDDSEDSTKGMVMGNFKILADLDRKPDNPFAEIEVQIVSVDSGEEIPKEVNVDSEGEFSFLLPEGDYFLSFPGETVKVGDYDLYPTPKSVSLEIVKGEVLYIDTIKLLLEESVESSGSGIKKIISADTKMEENGRESKTIASYTFIVPPVPGHSGGDIATVMGLKVGAAEGEVIESEGAGEWEVIESEGTINGITLTKQLTAGKYSKLKFHYYTDHSCMFNKSHIFYEVDYH